MDSPRSDDAADESKRFSSSQRPAENTGSRTDADRLTAGAFPGAPGLDPLDARVLLAHLARPHGRRGELIGDILTDFPERFQNRPRVFLVPPEGSRVSPKEARVESFWFLRDRVVLKFDCIDSINDAEKFRGYSVAIPSTERAPLPAGSVYISDLIGCSVVDLNSDTSTVGEVVDVDRVSSSTDLLVVRTPAPRPEEILIPFVKDYLVRLDAEAKLIQMRLPPGLLEINAPMTDDEKQEMRGDG